MNYTDRSLTRFAREISSLIEDPLIRVGIFYRIYFRCKTEKSLERKLNLTLPNGEMKYDGEIKYLRDLIGIRINVYFADDLELLTTFFRNKFKANFVEETIDQNTTTEFKPTRVNLIFRLLSPYDKEFTDLISDKRIDNTFELQLRTVFSEGWHEIEHDLRYKTPDDWAMYPELVRTFNGFLAGLETSEWSIIQLFERLSYSHYKSNSLSAMIRTKFRLRFEDSLLDSALSKIINDDDHLLRELFKIDRNGVIEKLLSYSGIYLLSKVSSFIFFVNHFFIKNTSLNKITPAILLEDFSKYRSS